MGNGWSPLVLLATMMMIVCSVHPLPSRPVEIHRKSSLKALSPSKKGIQDSLTFKCIMTDKFHTYNNGKMAVMVLVHCDM